MLKVRYIGEKDLVEIEDSTRQIVVHYYELQAYLRLIEKRIPAPCKNCKGTGIEALFEDNEPVSTQMCSWCLGSRIDRKED